MNRETIIISNLDLRILDYINEEKNITELMVKVDFGAAQCKRHLNRLKDYIEIRKYGNFKFIKINDKGKKILEIFT